MVSLARKEIWFRGIFHLIGILGESPFVSKLRKAESAQHSVPGDHRDNAPAKKEYTTLKPVPAKNAGMVPNSVKAAGAGPVRGWVTSTVGRFVYFLSA
jgi:hypothetical protein